MRNLLFLPWAMIALLLSGCAGNSRRAAESSQTSESCTAIVAEDVLIADSIQRVETVKLRKVGYGRCYTAYGLRLEARRIACERKAPFAHLYNIHQPGALGVLLSGPCAMADVDLYAAMPDHKPSPTPVITYDTLSNRGAELFLTFAGGSALGGSQEDPGLSPKPNVEKIALGISAEYFWNRLGAEAEFDYLGRGTARKDGYPNMSLYNTMSWRLGGTATLWSKTTLTGRMKVDAGAGANYTLLRLHDEFVDFIDSDGIITGWGGGFGGYAKLRYKVFTLSGFGGFLGIRYEFEQPTLDGANEALDAHVLQALFGLGYKF